MTSQIISEIVSLFDKGEFSAAEKKARAAIVNTPNELVFYNLLGASLHQQGKIEESISAYKRALEINESYAPALTNLGIIYRSAGDIRNAIDCYEKANAVSPDDPNCLNNLGNAYSDISRFDDAVLCFKKALKLNPALTIAQNSLAAVYFKSGQFKKALKQINKSIDSNPQYLESYPLKSNILEKMNRLDEADATLERALRAAPSHSTLLLTAARLKARRKEFDRAISEIQTALTAKPPLDDLDKASAHYLLGDCYDAAGDYKKALEAYKSANDLRRKTGEARLFDQNRYLSRLKELEKSFKAADPAIWTPSEPAHSRRAPVFLIGFPRSGTTLLGRVLGSHPKITTLDEKPPTTRLLAALDKTGNGNTEFPLLNAEQRKKLQSAYYKEVRAMGVNDRSLLIDKMPLNLARAAQLALVFPNAKFILALRHPCDAALSCFMQHFSPTDEVSNFYTLEDAARCYDNVMTLWRIYVQQLSLDCHSVKYEALVADPETVTRNLASFLGVSWSPNFLNHTKFADTQSAVTTPSYRQVSEKIYRDAVYRWRNYEPSCSDAFEALNPWIDYFNYTE